MLRLITGLERKTAAPAPAAPAGAGHSTKTLLRSFELKDIDEKARTFRGLGAAFSLDQGGDIILPGAFKRTLKDWSRSKRLLPLLDSHNGWGTVRAVIGKVTEASETSEGLEIAAQVIEGPDGDEVWRRIAGKYVDGLSIGYRTVEQRNPTDEEARTGVYRYIKELQLREISVCIWPMNGDARIDLASAKALIADAQKRTLSPDELDELKELHSQLSSLLSPPAPEGKDTPAPAAEGLDIEDPRRIEQEAVLRTLSLRSLGARS